MPVCNLFVQGQVFADKKDNKEVLRPGTFGHPCFDRAGPAVVSRAVLFTALSISYQRTYVFNTYVLHEHQAYDTIILYIYERTGSCVNSVGWTWSPETRVQ